jgi:hypothetical protein
VAKDALRAWPGKRHLRHCRGGDKAKGERDQLHQLLTPVFAVTVIELTAVGNLYWRPTGSCWRTLNRTYENPLGATRREIWQQARSRAIPEKGGRSGLQFSGYCRNC